MSVTNPITHLIDNGFDIKYVTKCITTLNDQTSTWLTPDKYVSEIEALLGITAQVSENLMHIRYTYFYVVQLILQYNKTHPPLNADDVWASLPPARTILSLATSKAASFCDDHLSSIREQGFDLPTTSPCPAKPKVLAHNTTTPKTITKTERAKAIYAAIITSHATPEDARDAVIDAFVSQLDMNRGGAVTYFSMCRRNHD